MVLYVGFPLAHCSHTPLVLKRVCMLEIRHSMLSSGHMNIRVWVYTLYLSTVGCACIVIVYVYMCMIDQLKVR